MHFERCNRSKLIMKHTVNLNLEMKKVIHNASVSMCFKNTLICFIPLVTCTNLTHETLFKDHY